MNLKKLAIGLFTALAISACGSSKHSDGGTSANNTDPGTTQKNTAASFHYFKGNATTFSYDMTISFDTTGYKITAKDSDPLCFKSGTYTEADAKTLFDKVSQLVMMSSGGIDPASADQIETIEITLTDGTKLKYHLLNGRVPAGELYATNPSDLRAYLQGLEASLVTACQ